MIDEVLCDSIMFDYLWGIMDLNRAILEPNRWIILVKLLDIRYNNFYEIMINNAIICIMWHDIDIIYDNEIDNYRFIRLINLRLMRYDDIIFIFIIIYIFISNLFI